MASDDPPDHDLSFHTEKNRALPGDISRGLSVRLPRMFLQDTPISSRGSRSESFPTYDLSWEKQLKPFLVERFPELKDLYGEQNVSMDRYCFEIPKDLTEDEVQDLRQEIYHLARTRTQLDTQKTQSEAKRIRQEIHEGADDKPQLFGQHTSPERRDEPFSEDQLPADKNIEQESDDIETLTKQCTRLLESCSLSPRLSENDWAQNRLDDFKLWSAGINATAPGHASLEWRLRSRSDIREVVLGFLGELIEKVSNCLTHVEKPVLKSEVLPREIDVNYPEASALFEDPSESSGTISPWSELSDEDDVEHMEQWPPQNPLKFEMKGAEVLLAQLARLSLVIRKAGAQLRWQRADLRFEEFQSRREDLQRKMDCSSLWTPHRNDINVIDQKLFQFRRRLEYAFVCNSYQEDIDPYKELLFRCFTSNEITKQPYSGSMDASVPSFSRDLTIEKWLLGLSDVPKRTEIEPQLRRHSNPSSPTKRTNTSRVARQQPPEYHSYGNPWPTTVIRKFLTDPSRISVIQQRLLDANVKRRNRFEVARKNAKPLIEEPRREPVAPEISLNVLKTEKLPVETSTVVAQPTAPIEEVKVRTLTVTKTVESATELGSQIQLPDSKLITPSKITAVSRRGAKMKYPKKPQIDGDRQTFVCPYCYQVLPIIYAKEGWRSHIAQDLQPYSCVLDNCPVPSQLFGSSKEWSDHMEQAHSSDKWMCYSCSDTPQVFESPSEYKRHLLESEAHSDSFTPAQLPLLIEDGRTPVVPHFETCPICQWSEQHANFKDIFEEQTSTRQNQAITIDDHIAEHLHSFALQALPDLDDDETDSLQLSMGSVENNLKLLKEYDDSRQYTSAERRALFDEVATFYQISFRRANYPNSKFLEPLNADPLAVIWQRGWHDFWIPSTQHIQNLEAILSIIRQNLEYVDGPPEIIDQLSGHFNELLADVISDFARSRWRRALMVARIYVYTRMRSPNRPGSFPDTVNLVKGKNLLTTPPLSPSRSTFVGKLVEELVDGLCTFCNAIIRFFENLDLDVQYADFDLHPSLIGLRSSAKLGCRLCVVFVVAINNRYGKYTNNIDWSNASWDYIRSYGLTVQTVNNYLKWRFGDWVFNTMYADSNLLQFWVPEKLSDKEKLDLRGFSRQHIWRRPARSSQSSRFLRSLFTPRKFHVVFTQDMRGARILTLASGNDEIQIYEICCARDDYLAAQKWTTVYTSTKNPLGRTSIDCIKSWQDLCSSQHAVCNKSSPKDVPTRLLKLEDSGDLRLVEVGADIGNVQYCTLSYCWGRAQWPYLTQSNFSMFLHHISTKDMPKTYQDAFLTARALGFCYVWIDAMCIIQDSSEDWKVEASQLLTYFENSFLNIVVAAANSADDGFLNFFTRPDLGDHIFIEAQKDVEIPGRRWQHALHIRALSKERDNDYPLYHRGWAFQEVLLAPRVLAFQSNSIIWCCGSVVLYDTGTTQMSRFWEFLISVRKQIGNLTMDVPSACNLWLTIVEFYSGLSLTFRKDKLVAISGVAQKLARLAGLEYAAGIWREDIIQGLLWFNPLGSQLDRVGGSEAYIAPTWSWASHPNKVKFHISWSATEDSQHQVMADALDTQISYANDMKYGAVQDGWIILRAPFTDLDTFRDLSGDSYILHTDYSMEEKDLKDVLFLACVRSVVGPDLNHWVGLALKPARTRQTQSSSVPLTTYSPGFDMHAIVSNFKATEEPTYQRIGLVEGTFRPPFGAEPKLRGIWESGYLMETDSFKIV